MKFKIGDKVKITKSSRWYQDNDKVNPIHEIGVIEYINKEYLRVKWKNLTNTYQEGDLELAKEKSNKQLAKEYLYDTITSKSTYIVTTLENRDKFYKLLDLLNIEYYNYENGLLDRYKILYTEIRSFNGDNIIHQSLSIPNKYFEFEDILKEYKQILNNK